MSCDYQRRKQVSQFQLTKGQAQETGLQGQHIKARCEYDFKPPARGEGSKILLYAPTVTVAPKVKLFETSARTPQENTGKRGEIHHFAFQEDRR